MTDVRDMPDEPLPDTTAGELALGLLEGGERAAATRRMLSDRVFAAEVEHWRQRFGAFFDMLPEQAPPPGLRARIEHSIADPVTASGRAWFWPIVAAVAGIAAAVLLALLVARPAPPAPLAAPARLLAAAIQPTDGRAAAIVAIYDPARTAIQVGASPIDDAAHSAELWVIAGKAPPRPLGLMHGVASTLMLAAPERVAMTAGSTLAISREPAGGSPTGLPTGPVIAAGKLQPV